MIQDVDESLRALVRRDALSGNGVEIAFDAPTREWVAKRNAPVVDLYLYDIREDTTRRDVQWEAVRDETGRVTERRPPPRRYRLSYLLTAWTQRPEDEHRLLSAMLTCFVSNEYVPMDLLSGSLADAPAPVYLTVALPPAEDRSIADVWTAMGGELKPSLDLVVTAPLVIRRSHEAGPPVLEEPVLRVVRTDTPAAAALPAASGKGRAKAAASGPDAPAAVTPPSIADETRRAGTDAKPGRTVRVREMRGR